MIKPTIGRVVLVNVRGGLDFANIATHDQKPIPALICAVWSDRCINVGGFDCNGRPFAMPSLPLVQEGDDIPEQGSYAEWMPYQKGQAAKTEALEAQVGRVAT